MNLILRVNGATWTYLSLDPFNGPRYIDILSLSTGKRHFNAPMIAPIKTDIDVLINFQNKMKRV